MFLLYSVIDLIQLKIKLSLIDILIRRLFHPINQSFNAL